ncbi:MAG TPA: CoA-binding protein [Candidatus Deferrimicrobium sp.]|nr:CoA-binding protein [Candidatus Deferrimicrobium sp.]
MESPNLEPFFHPKSIAIIGASTKPFKFGSLFLKALLDFQYVGKIYPVNPRRIKIQGLDSWKLEDVPAPIDLVYITVPATQVPTEIEKCKGKTKSVIILTAGFKETGEEGKQLEEESAKVAQECGVRVIGPNCFGIYHPNGGITLLPGGDFPRETGNVAMLSQSGGHSVNFTLLGQSAGLRFSKVISYGNALDLDLPDFLEFLNNDAETKVVAAYVEGVRNMEKLKQVLGGISKPLILWKSGLTEDGARAATSHTGFLSGQAEVWKGFFQQYRNKILMVNSFEELLDTTIAMTYLPRLEKKIDYTNKIGVIGGGGGIGIEISDIANQYGLKIPKLSEGKEELKSLLPLEGTSINNPLDIGNPMYMGDQKKVLDVFMSDPNIKVLIYDFIVDFVIDLKLMFRIIKNYKEKNNIPIIVILRELLNTSENLALEKKSRKFRDAFHEIHVPVFPSFYRGIRALANYLKYYSECS